MVFQDAINRVSTSGFWYWIWALLNINPNPDTKALWAYLHTLLDILA
ncbi:hypothetical protein [Nostoc sp.]